MVGGSAKIMMDTFFAAAAASSEVPAGFAKLELEDGTAELSSSVTQGGRQDGRLAVDGDARTCASTVQTNEARWWRVGLGSTHPIQAVSISVSRLSYQELTVFAVGKYQNRSICTSGLPLSVASILP